MSNLQFIQPELQAIIHHGVASVEEDPDHDLSLSWRCTIYSKFGGRTKQGDGVQGMCEGHWRRYAVGVMSAKKVLPIWEACFPNDRSPHTCLELAHGYMSGQVPKALCLQTREELWTHCDGMVYKYQTLMNKVLVGYCTAQIMRVAVYDDLWCEPGEAEGVDEANVDPEELDVAFCSASCYAGGTKWDESSSTKKRLEFWKWWLLEAVPAAWSKAKE
jgi:hypothetical protein